jgi:hypothetical protein
VFWTLGLGVAILLSRTFEEPRGSSWEMGAGIRRSRGRRDPRARRHTALRATRRRLDFGGSAGGPPFRRSLWARAHRLTPWTIRNITHYGRFVLVASDGGVTFWTGNNSLATGEGDMAANPHLKLANQALRARHPGLNEEQMEPVYYQESFDWIRANPAAWIGADVQEAVLTSSSRLARRTRPGALATRYYAASLISVGLLVPLAAIGLWRLRGATRTAGGHVAARAGRGRDVSGFLSAGTLPDSGARSVIDLVRERRVAARPMGGRASVRRTDCGLTWRTLS